MRFDLATLTLFINVIDHGSITRAAEREHIVASAASKRISDLEAQLGVALLVRQHAGVVPTAAGEALARHAREVTKTLDRIPDALRILDRAAGEHQARQVALRTGYTRNFRGRRW